MQGGGGGCRLLLLCRNSLHPCVPPPPLCLCSSPGGGNGTRRSHLLKSRIKHLLYVLHKASLTLLPPGSSGGSWGQGDGPFTGLLIIEDGTFSARIGKAEHGSYPVDTTQISLRLGHPVAGREASAGLDFGLALGLWLWVSPSVPTADPEWVGRILPQVGVGDPL